MGCLSSWLLPCSLRPNYSKPEKADGFGTVNNRLSAFYLLYLKLPEIQLNSVFQAII